MWDDSRECEFLARRRQRVVETYKIRQKDDTELQRGLGRLRQVSFHFLPGLEATVCPTVRVVVLGVYWLWLDPYEVHELAPILTEPVESPNKINAWNQIVAQRSRNKRH